MDEQTGLQTRRSLLMTGVGALLASAATALGRPAPAAAADGAPVLLGKSNNATNTTVVFSPDSPTLRAQTSSVKGTAVEGVGTFAGVVGLSTNSATGVLGFSGGPLSTPPTTSKGAGVRGNSNSGIGVLGESAGGSGVQGSAGSGVGVEARSTSGDALRVVGRAAFSRAGSLVVGLRATSATKTGIALTSGSLILAVAQQNVSDVYVRAVVPNVAGSSFTIYLNKSTPVAIKVAYFVIG